MRTLGLRKATDQYRSRSIRRRREPLGFRVPAERPHQSLDGLDGLWASDSRYRTADSPERTSYTSVSPRDGRATFRSGIDTSTPAAEPRAQSRVRIVSQSPQRWARLRLSPKTRKKWSVTWAPQCLHVELSTDGQGATVMPTTSQTARQRKTQAGRGDVQLLNEVRILRTSIVSRIPRFWTVTGFTPTFR